MENVQYLSESTVEKQISDTNRIAYYIPDLPSVEDIYPVWKSIDTEHRYSNFGPLEQGLRKLFMQRFFNTELEEFVTFTNSGTSAISLALRTLKLPRGSKVILPALTFPATAFAILNAGLEPVFVDTGNELELDAKKVYSLIQKHDIRAVVPVFYHSEQINSYSWDRFYTETGIPVIVDACPALDAQSLPQHCVMTFSLHATKYYGIGEGGAVVANDTHYISDVRKLSNFALNNGEASDWGDNAKLSEYHAAVGHIQMQRYVEIKSRKDKIIEYYRIAFENYTDVVDVISALDRNPSYMLITTKFCSIDSLVAYLNNHGIETRRFHYPLLPEHSFFKNNFYLSESNDLNVNSQNLISLPFHNSLSEEDVARITNTITSYIKQQIPNKLKTV